MELSLNGRSYLVTGGGSGIGKGVAEALVDSGGNVVIVGRSAERLSMAAKDIATRSARSAEAVHTFSADNVENREWYRALNAYKMAVICLIGAMLVDEGASDDMKLVVAASGTHLLTQLGLAQLGITDQRESGPVAIRDERIAELESRATAAH